MSLVNQTIHYIKQWDKIQKIGIAYCILIFLCIVFLPIIQLQQINNTDITLIRLIHPQFILLDLLFVVVLSKCILYIASLQYKSLILHLTGLKIE